MKRRELIVTAIAAPPLLLTGCANRAWVRTGAVSNPFKAQITVLNDAFGRDPTLQKDWGYAALVEVGSTRLLFDTGNNPEVLARNTAALNVDLGRLDFVVMSHRHGDHIGGISHLLSVNPRVRIFAPKEGFGVFGSDLKSSFYRRDETLRPDQRYYAGTPPETMVFGSAWPQANITLIDKTTEIAPGMHLIALVSDKPGTLELKELSLAIRTPDGLVIVVGCSHPGIDKIVRAATAIDPKINLVTGGLHLLVAKDADIETTVATLRDTYQVGHVAPGHCTGEPTFTALQRAFGGRYVYAGLGSTILLGATPRALDASGQATPAALSENDLQTYQTLLAASADRRRKLFTGLQGTAMQGDRYLAQWRRSLVGCC